DLLEVCLGIDTGAEKGDIREERRPGIEKRNLKGVGVHHVYMLDRTQNKAPLLRGIPCPVQGELHIGCREGRPIMKCHAMTQMKGIDGSVLRDVPTGCQV